MITNEELQSALDWLNDVDGTIHEPEYKEIFKQAIKFTTAANNPSEDVVNEGAEFIRFLFDDDKRFLKTHQKWSLKFIRTMTAKIWEEIE